MNEPIGENKEERAPSLFRSPKQKSRWKWKCLPLSIGSMPSPVFVRAADYARLEGTLRQKWNQISIPFLSPPSIAGHWHEMEENYLDATKWSSPWASKQL